MALRLNSVFTVENVGTGTARRPVVALGEGAFPRLVYRCTLVGERNCILDLPGVSLGSLGISFLSIECEFLESRIRILQRISPCTVFILPSSILLVTKRSSPRTVLVSCSELEEMLHVQSYSPSKLVAKNQGGGQYRSKGARHRAEHSSVLGTYLASLDLRTSQMYVSSRSRLDLPVSRRNATSMSFVMVPRKSWC